VKPGIAIEVLALEAQVLFERCFIVRELVLVLFALLLKRMCVCLGQHDNDHATEMWLLPISAPLFRVLRGFVQTDNRADCVNRTKNYLALDRLNIPFALVDKFEALCE
jgi:hypothetical protein